MIVVITLSPRDYDAVLFDRFLEQRATQADEPFVPFDIDTDYPRYVDGKARYDGVAAFLSSHAGSNCRWGHPKTAPTCKACAPWAI